jgi:hypothetical protein
MQENERKRFYREVIRGHYIILYITFDRQQKEANGATVLLE